MHLKVLGRIIMLKNDIEAIDQFDDSMELAEVLNNMGIDSEGQDRYYMQECAVQIRDMWHLLVSIRNNSLLERV